MKLKPPAPGMVELYPVSNSNPLPDPLIDNRIRHHEFLRQQMEQEYGEKFVCRWSMYVFDPVFKYLILYPQLNDKLLYFDPPFEFILPVYVGHKDVPNHIEAVEDYVYLDELCTGNTMREIWFTANRLCQSAIDECNDHHPFLEEISLSNDPTTTKFNLFFGS